MESNIQDPITIRRYLLCQLTDERLIGEVAEAMLCDDAFAETVELAEEDLIEDYLEQRLSESERSGFEKRLENSSELRERLGLVKGLKQRSDRRVSALTSDKAWSFPFNFFRLPAFQFAVVLVGIIAIGIVVWRIGFVSNNTEIALADLRKSVSGQRTTIGRSSLDSSYAPVVTTRGPRQSIEQASPEFRNARALLLTAEVEAPGDAKVLHMLGMLYLAEQDLDKALAEMLKAEKLGSTDSVLLADIGAVYFERSARDRSAESGETRTRDLVLSLDYTERSLKLRPDRTETIFNQALILSEMGLSTKARKAWEDYLQRDPSSEWASEARKRLESLDKAKAVSHVPDQILSEFWAAYDTQDNEKAWQIVSETKELISGSIVFFQLAKRYVNAGTAEEASRSLDGMRFVAGLEAARTADKYFSELYKYYSDLGRENKDLLVRAAERSDVGYKAMLAGNNWTEVASAFEDARALYTKARNPWEADLATFQVCYSLTQQRQVDESSKCLTSLSDSSTSKHHYWVTSLADGWQASNRSLNGDYSASIGFNERSLANAKLSADVLGMQKAVSQLVSQYSKLGNEERVIQIIGQASSLTPRYFQSSRQLSRNLLFISQGFHRFGYFAGAEAYADEHLTVASDVLKDAWLTHSAHLNRASALSRLGRVDEALLEADRALQISRTFTDPVMSKRLTFQSTLLRADIYRESGRCSDGVTDYDRVVADNPSTEFVTSLYRARRGRLECLAALGRGAEFVNEMEAVIGLFENSQRIIEDESDRHIFFHGEQSVYDLGTEFAFSKLNDPLMAFSYSERSRANSLLEQIPGQTPEPSLDTLQSVLPEGVSILYFAVLAERTLIWVVSKDKWEVRSIPISGQDLEEQVNAFSNSILRKAYSKQSAESLYSLLLEPVAQAISGKRLLCIVPDKSLAMLSFAALRQPGGEKFLIEQVALTYSPGSRVLSKLSDTPVPRPAVSEGHFVGIAATEFDRAGNPGLDDIPGAASEVDEIAQKYDRPTKFVGNSATRSAFTSAVDDGAIFHFAGHYVANRKSPDRSKFLLADGDLTVGDLSRQIVHAPKVVILSACDSGIERYYSGEGMIGAARVFLAAGVPTVIGSRWAVDSEATRELMTKFHENRSVDPSEGALRSAQIQMILAGPQYAEPYFWAGVSHFGDFS